MPFTSSSYVSLLVPELSLADIVVFFGCGRMSVIRLLRKNQGRFSLLLFLGDFILMVLRCSAKDVVAALIKRLAHRNANVQLYTLEVCNKFWAIGLFYANPS